MLCLQKAGGDDSYGSIQGIRCFSVSSSLAEAAATTSAETPAGALEDSVRDANDGDVSAFLGEFAMLQAQQKVVEAVDIGEEDGVGGGRAAAEGAPFFQRSSRRTTTMPNGSLAGKQPLVGTGLERELLSAAAASSLQQEFSSHEAKRESNISQGGAWAPTPASRSNGRCVRIDTNALAAASSVRQDYSNIIAGEDVAALLGDLKLLQEASAASRTSPTAEANVLFQRNNRRTTTLPGTMANVKIRASAQQ